MKFLARTATGEPLIGDEGGFVPLASVHPDIETVREALPLAAAGELGDLDEATASRIEPRSRSFGAPLERFGKLWGIGLNYEEHAGDLDEDRPTEPASFHKPANTLAGPGGPIRLPPTEQSERVTAEAELAVLVGRESKDLDAEQVEDVIAGFLPVIDMTAEDVLQRNPRFLTRAKSYDNFLVVGRAIAVPEEPMDLEDLTVTTEVNGTVEASNEIRNMLFPPREIVRFHSHVMTLGPGDLFSTGTPGAAHIEPGDQVRSIVDSIGTVSAPVVRQDD